MRVLRCSVANFRGFEHIEIVPREHVVLVGEPRAGRSDLLAALAKVFEADATRMDEFDFHNSDVSKDVEIEVIVGNLGQTLEQRFLDRLEFWDQSTSTLIEGVDDPGALPADANPVLRLAYRARWERDEERSDQTVYWAKGSDPSTDDLRRIPRDDRAAPINLARRRVVAEHCRRVEAHEVLLLVDLVDALEELLA